MSDLALRAAQRFASLLDRRSYNDLATVLASECVYEFRGGTIQGANAISETYRTNTEWGFDVFDRIDFESEVFAETDTSARIRFSDHLVHGDAEHLHMCEQVVMIDDEGQIVRIIHHDLPGETDALNAFMMKCGIAGPSDQSDQ